MRNPEGNRPPGGYVAFVLAVGLSIALNVLTGALLFAAVARYHAGAGLELSENGTQLLTAWGSGIVGVLGAWIGFSVGKRQSGDEPPPPPLERPG